MHDVLASAVGPGRSVRACFYVCSTIFLNLSSCSVTILYETLICVIVPTCFALNSQML
jgi:hypothetical protein